ncbi:MAG: TrkA C-terminal domain-containing protein, partial [bacterium]
ILSRTVLAEEIEKLTEPLRDVFSALFFVSMGMLIVPGDLAASWSVILALSALVMVGKLFSCWTGFVLAGQRASVSLRASLPKTHIGEFSFVIAALGASLQVTDARLKAVASGVACVSILATPFLNTHANKVIGFFQTKCPREIRDFAQLYHNWLELFHFGVRKNVFLRMAFRPLLRVVVNFFLFNAILVAGSFALRNMPLPLQWQMWNPWLHGLFLVVLAALGIPFLVDILRNLDVMVLLILETVFNRPAFRRIFQGAFREFLNHILRFFVFLLFGFVFLLVSAPYLPSAVGFVLFLIASGVLAIALWRRAIRLHSRMEGAVLRSMVDQSRAALTESLEEALEHSTVHNPWPVILEEISVAPRSRSVGLKIKDLNLRNLTGATIIAVSRGSVSVQESLPDIPLFPHDKLLLFGEKDQIEAAERHINQSGAHGRGAASSTAHALQKILVPRASDFVGLSLRETRLPQNYGVTVLGIQRKDKKVIGPRAEEIIEAEDLLFVMGAPRMIQQLKEKLSSPS